eukprot:scaffold22229_cov78-Cyclotella_meneghiniana.AAC.5
MLLFNVQLVDWISRQQSAPERDASTASSVGCATQEQIVTGFVLPGETPRIRIPTLLLVYVTPMQPNWPSPTPPSSTKCYFEGELLKPALNAFNLFSNVLLIFAN